jgi:hypothetical protein
MRFVILSGNSSIKSWLMVAFAAFFVTALQCPSEGDLPCVMAEEARAYWLTGR